MVYFVCEAKNAMVITQAVKVRIFPVPQINFKI